MAQKADDIIELLRTDRKQAFQQLYKKYYSMVSYLIKKNSGSKEDAADIFQESLVVLYEQSLQPNFKINCLIKTYLYSIARNLWLKELRTRKQKLNIKDYERHISLNLEEYQEEKEDSRKDVVKEAMKRLGENCQKILLSYYYQNKKMNDIAVELGYTNAANAKNQKYKCMQKLKQMTLAAINNG